MAATDRSPFNVTNAIELSGVIVTPLGDPSELTGHGTFRSATSATWIASPWGSQQMIASQPSAEIARRYGSEKPVSVPGTAPVAVLITVTVPSLCRQEASSSGDSDPVILSS
jgi:hypothetical protein